jgi:hypothetical protein
MKLESLQHIPRWALYLLLLLIGFLFTHPAINSAVRLPIYPGPETKAFYDTIESIPANKIVLLDSCWDAGSMAENEPQCRAALTHLMRRRLPIVMISMEFTALGPVFGRRVFDQVNEQLQRDGFPPYVYGKDFVQFGFRKGTWTNMQLLAKDFLGTFSADINGTKSTDFAKLPLMQRVRSIDDIGAVVSITYQPSEDYIRFIRGPYGTKILFAAMTILSTSYYPYLDTKQLAGVLVGIRGAAEYEELLHYKSGGHQMMTPQSFVHVLIVVLVILGNIGFAAERRRKKQ